jgi:hypothetical protein
MNYNIKTILLLVSITVLLIIVCNIHSLDAVDITDNRCTEPQLNTQIDSKPNPTSQGIVGDFDQLIFDQTIQVQAPISPAGSLDASSYENMRNILNLEHLDSILNQVNLGGPERPGSNDVIIAGSSPGTESKIGFVNTRDSLRTHTKPVRP